MTSAKIASGVDAIKISSGGVDNTEFGYLDGVTSAVQTQLNGKVAGPASATDNAIARFDGTTGKLVQNSGVVIDDSGKVGIGTANPGTSLEVIRDTTAANTLSSAATLTRTTSGTAASGLGTALSYQIENDSGSNYTAARVSSSLTTTTSGSEEANLQFFVGSGANTASTSGGLKMTILGSNGNVGIGTTNPTQKLQVGFSGDGSVAIANAWNTFSDIRLKRDLVKLPEALNKLEELSGYYYFWKDGEDQSRQVGVVAQEVEQVLPELVKTGQDGIKTVDYPKLTALLIEAAKQLKADAEKFKADNEAIKMFLCQTQPQGPFCRR